MLDVTELSVTYGDGTKGLIRASFRLEAGEKCALIGENGAGKTTLLMALVGVLPSAGDVTAAGITLSTGNLGAVRQKVGMLMQNPDDQLFLPTILQDVAFGPKNLGYSQQEAEERAREMLERLEIGHLAGRSALRLSGGEKRMAALAAVLVMEPEVLLLDEPTAFLDPKARRRLMRVLTGLPQTMLIATHDLGFALEVCPGTLLIRGGEILWKGESRTLLFDDGQMERAGVESLPVYSGLSKKNEWEEAHGTARLF